MPDGRRSAYTDFGGPGAPLLALHGHFRDGRSFGDLAREVGPRWRVITLDERGHGESDRAAADTGEGYVADAAAVLEYVGLGPAVVVGHSLGGVDAYRLAARRPDLVRAVAVEDIGAVEGIGAVDDDLSHAPGNCVRLGDGEGFYDALRGFLARV
ncbi:alpha/beta hydrolase [Streptomyces sp. NBC_00555]|nr:alpha/beta hydrolase [Streptomyces sp. NBC_00555]